MAQVFQRGDVARPIALFELLPGHAFLKTQVDVSRLLRIAAHAEHEPALFLPVGAVPHRLRPGAGGVALQSVLILRVQVLDQHAQARAVLRHMTGAQHGFRAFLDRLKEEHASPVRQIDLAAAVVRLVNGRTANPCHRADPRLGAEACVLRLLRAHAAEQIDLPATAAANVVWHQPPGLMAVLCIHGFAPHFPLI